MTDKIINKYYFNNREAKLEYGKTYYQRNKEKRREYNREYYKRHRPKMCEIWREGYKRRKKETVKKLCNEPIIKLVKGKIKKHKEKVIKPAQIDVIKNIHKIKKRGSEQTSFCVDFN